MIGLYRLVTWYRRKKILFNKVKVNLDNIELGPITRPSASLEQPFTQDEEEEEEERDGVWEERQAKQLFVKRSLETIFEIEEDSSGYVQYNPASPPAAS